MPAAEFWDSTPRIIVLTFKAHDLRLQREHNDRAWLAWHIAVLPHMKPIPKLDELLIKPRVQQTTEQMRETMRMLARTFK